MADRLTIAPREGLGVAGVMARKGVNPDAIGEALGVELPSGPRATFAGVRTVVGTGPDAWLILDEDAAPGFADDVAERLRGLASVSDQSSGYVVQRISGPQARTLLQRGVALDLHPDAFRAGSAAATMIAHIGVVLWQVDERPTYDLAVARSYADSFGHWLRVTAVGL